MATRAEAVAAWTLHYEADTAACRGSQTTGPKPAAPTSPLLGVLQRSPTTKLDGRCLRLALPGRRLLKRIGALKPAERGEGDTDDWRNRRPPGGFVCRKLRSGIGCRLAAVCQAGGYWGWLPWLG